MLSLIMLCLPLSMALTYLFIALFFATFTIDLAIGKKTEGYNSFLFWAPLLLYLYLILSIAWSPGSIDLQLEAVSKYKKLVFLSLLGVVFYSYRKTNRSINYFIAAVSFCASISILTKLGITEFFIPSSLQNGRGWDIITPFSDKAIFYIGGPENPTFGRNHITQGLFSAFAAIFLLSPVGKKIYRHEFNRVGLIILNISTLFILNGRTGPAVLIAYVILVLIYKTGAERPPLSRIRLPYIILTIIAASAIFPWTQPFHSVQNWIIQQVNQLTPTSTNERLSFMLVGYHQWVSDPLNFLFGSGLGSFKTIYETHIFSIAYLRGLAVHPHSELVLLITHAGLVGLLGTYFYVRKVIESLDSDYKLIYITLLFSGLINSSIWDAADGYFTIILLALLGSRIPKGSRFST
jgi:hypothetical protein